MDGVLLGRDVFDAEHSKTEVGDVELLVGIMFGIFGWRLEKGSGVSLGRDVFEAEDAKKERGGVKLVGVLGGTTVGLRGTVDAACPRPIC